MVIGCQDKISERSKLVLTPARFIDLELGLIFDALISRRKMVTHYSLLLKVQCK